MIISIISIFLNFVLCSTAFICGDKCILGCEIRQNTRNFYEICADVNSNCSFEVNYGLQQKVINKLFCYILKLINSYNYYL